MGAFLPPTHSADKLLFESGTILHGYRAADEKKENILAEGEVEIYFGVAQWHYSHNVCL